MGKSVTIESQEARDQPPENQMASWQSTQKEERNKRNAATNARSNTLASNHQVKSTLLGVVANPIQL